MYKRVFSDVWEALATVYLKDFEIMDYYRDTRRNRKKFVNLIKKRLFDDIWERMQRYGEKEPPFIKEDSKFIKYDRRAYIKKVDVKYGCMILKDDRFEIRVDKKAPLPLQRTLYAHELGHTFLYNTDRTPIEPFYLKHSTMIYTNSRNIYKSEFDESLAYEIGRFLLIPTPALEKYVSRHPSLDVFLKECERFIVTKDIMARRLFWDVYDWSCGEKYWDDAFLILYPVAKIKKNGHPPPPERNDEVFKGTFFRNFRMKKIWAFLVQMLYQALIDPEETISSNDCKGFSEYKLIKFKGRKIEVEMKYLPQDKRVYVLGRCLR